jgi:hypothetical protein
MLMMQVRAARAAVQQAQRECGGGADGVHVDFSGSESRW